MYKCNSQLINEFKTSCSALKEEVGKIPSEKIGVVKDILGLYSKKWEASLEMLIEDERKFKLNNCQSLNIKSKEECNIR